MNIPKEDDKVELTLDELKTDINEDDYSYEMLGKQGETNPTTLSRIIEDMENGGYKYMVGYEVPDREPMSDNDWSLIVDHYWGSN